MLMEWMCKVIAVSLAVGLLALPEWVTAQQNAPVPWVLDAAVPGPDLPPRGRSLFDYLRGASETPVPFPFTALLTRIRARLQLPDAALEPYAAVLIPVGRSLQRHAAAPDYYRFPRVVVAVLGESATPATPLLKDRLYLGYQEQSGVLEVISYNEAMGRFEFQVVKDYRPGATPRVYYARRAICTACHQNQAPIFARPLWRETNANPAVAARLLEKQRDFYGITVRRGVDIPGAIDAATQRANSYAFTQLLWTEGCDATPEAAHCRAALIEAALQLRLSGRRAYRSSSAALAAIRAVWQRRWPAGLRQPNPDIPNRDPLAEGNAAATAREVSVPVAVDPLLPRPALAVVHFEQGNDQDAVIAGLAEFFSEADIQQLDAALTQRGKDMQPRSYSADCQFTRTSDQTSQWRLDVRCAAASEPALAVEGRLYFSGQHLQRGAFDRIRVQDDTLNDVSVSADIVASASGIDLSLQRGALQARRRNGNALTTLRLQWPAAAALAANFTGHLVLDERQDYPPLSAAVQALSELTIAGKSDVFTAEPLRRASLMPALFTQLGIAASPACCLDAAGLPAPRLEPGVTLDLTAQSGLEPRRATALRNLQRYCAPCHDSAERFPPNFLSGDLDTVQAKLTHCAARIEYRLGMWDLSPTQRAKTPMPPELALRADQIDPAQWPANPALSQVRDYIRSLRGTRTVVSPDYPQLQTCLPEGP
jgi:hypothetical protein